MNGTLVLVRHGESLWNAKDLWTGWTDISLSEKGKKEAVMAAHLLKDTVFDYAFSSKLSRAKETLRIILDVLQQAPPITENSALNERNYGVYTGKNKFEIKKQIGEEAFLRVRRGWDYPIPGGESLKQIYERVIPYYEKEIAPLVKSGKHVLVASHGNTIRALIKHIEHVSDEDIVRVELVTGEFVIFKMDSSGVVISKEKRMV